VYLIFAFHNFFFLKSLTKQVFFYRPCGQTFQMWLLLKTLLNFYIFKNSFQEYQEVGSSGKGLDLGGIPIKFKVRIPFSANNSLGTCLLVKLDSYPICVERVLCTCLGFA
jgi:hypothetical protein